MHAPAIFKFWGKDALLHWGLSSCCFSYSILTCFQHHVSNTSLPPSRLSFSTYHSSSVRLHQNYTHLPHFASHYSCVPLYHRLRLLILIEITRRYSKIPRETFPTYLTFLSFFWSIHLLAECYTLISSLLSLLKFISVLA
jgi:hypothetical protein